LLLYKQDEDALLALQEATRLEPGNPQAKFTRAGILIKMGRLGEALEQLTAVRDFVPREASVHLKMGQVCKKLGRIDEAMKHLTTALDLDPKDSNLIKATLDKLNETDDQDDTL
jgi:anaphase-promoting complex subunit 3